MDIDFSDIITLDKELSALDQFVIDFTTILNEQKIKYVIVSGYVSILFGRNRTSEDVDLIIEHLPEEKFDELWNTITAKFECINTTSISEAYNNYIKKRTAIRFSEKDTFIPNMEVKFPNGPLDHWTLEQRKEVILNGHTLFISPLELQIPFKLFLGSEKDFEDARYLYRLFADKINSTLLQDFTKKLKMEDAFKRYIDENARY